MSSKRKIFIAGATALLLGSAAAGSASADPRYREYRGGRGYYGWRGHPEVRRYHGPVVVPRAYPYPYAQPYPYAYPYYPPPVPLYGAPVAPWAGFGFGGPGWNFSFGF